MLRPVTYYRVAHFLHRKHVPVVPKLIDYFIRAVFACWLPHTARIGKNFTLGYGGLGVVIHGHSVIGDNVQIDQNVTLGGNATEFGVPTIGSNVFIGCGAKILGPITVGDGAIVGANAVVIRDVPSNAVVAGVPARVIRENVDQSKYLYHLRPK